MEPAACLVRFQTATLEYRMYVPGRENESNCALSLSPPIAIAFTSEANHSKTRSLCCCVMGNAPSRDKALQSLLRMQTMRSKAPPTQRLRNRQSLENEQRNLDLIPPSLLTDK
jgi:hypothetical protein